MGSPSCCHLCKGARAAGVYCTRQQPPPTASPSVCCGSRLSNPIAAVGQPEPLQTFPAPGRQHACMKSELLSTTPQQVW
ncbi:hypothetical protein NDU88_004645 [Pleurodeles waltl]|uniref:Uncharacterized protein n=1 Tax=Pleurodeles waltl TaxID=8319 RepID=A0AAV7QD60_PLEWA|nr:hypothetical protein NDU88_004645 [Pleurodeles waltl]